MKKIFLFFIMAASCLFTSCVHKDLCYDHPPHAKKWHLNLQIDYQQEWEQRYGDGINWKENWPDTAGVQYADLIPNIPTGVRVRLYRANGNSEFVNIPAQGDVINVGEGENSLILYNNDTEAILFNDLESFASAQATTRGSTRSSYKGNSVVKSATKTEVTVTPPDMLYGSYIESIATEKQVTPEDVKVTMKPLVYTYLIRYEFSNGLRYVSRMEGALAGMAGDVYLNSGRTSSRVVTLLYECTKEDFGGQAIVNSFGIPDFPNDNYSKGDEDSNPKFGLNINVYLKNGKLFTFDFDVTDQVKAQPHGGVIIVKGIEIPDDEGLEGSGGFDVDVDDWGDWENIDLGIQQE